MRHTALQILTWGTVTAAVLSALWLAATDPGLPESLRLGELRSFKLPLDPPQAGRPGMRDVPAEAPLPAASAR